jgi:hypothetical protein
MAQVLYEVPPSRCPHCGAQIDTCSVVGRDTAQPEPAEPALCVACCCIVTFEADGRVRKITHDELLTFAKANRPQFEELVAYQRRIAIRAMLERMLGQETVH